MNEHKFSKSYTHNDIRTTINEQDESYIEECRIKRETLPGLRGKLLSLERLGSAQRPISADADILQLKQDIREIENAEVEYLFNLSKFIDQTQKTPAILLDLPDTLPAVPPTDGNTSGKESYSDETHWNCVGRAARGSAYTKYMEVCFNQPTVETPMPETVCERCSTSMLVDIQRAQVSCPNCAHCRTYKDPQQLDYREGIHITTPYAYKRINHFKEWLAQLQAKETTDIPEEIYDALRSELKKERIIDPMLIDNTRLRRYLKKLRYNKYYEHIPVIINRLTGKRAPSLTKELEAELIRMFTFIQEPFRRHCKIVAPTRKNFLSYSYTLRQMCTLLGHRELAMIFPLLKSRDKNYIQDQIWKAICGEVGWTYHRTV